MGGSVVVVVGILKVKLHFHKRMFSIYHRTVHYSLHSLSIHPQKEKVKAGICIRTLE
jgi:hypothetical protein